ncbi:oye family NADH-dependent flavin oxidoreductase [Streptomyces himastatinicus ATCC 53653]|uniref:Oye family NADH-dependent flavin oxidoreductase n=1 Tax=Streptomyces himastatinicus ATCC 53653 TaxID=457427 RepID=D9WKM6_9ACTN|nr:NADH:flavin oxidoreductase [Streptomyces himastatinicus]EFL27716.1 oye family NADH-dependent flavin oxidoreductase [Streptomyces himastatinicus ATCC 53653]
MPASSAAADRAAQTLSRPFTLRGLTVPNRIVMAPMTRDFSPGGVPGADMARYYARRAAGGVGLIVTEGTYVRHDSAGDSVRAPLFHGEDALAGWKNVVAEVHRAGGRIMAQICHVGVQRAEGSGPVPDAPTVGPSGLGLDGAPAGKAMTQNDLDAVIAAFADAAAAAERTGFDGVELHGAHGLLIDQFLWERTNRRTDGYGGDPVARTRFAAEIVAACRKAVSADFPIVFRTSQWKVNNYDARLATTPQELEAILTPLAEAGVDAFHSSTRRYWLPEFEDSDLNLAGWTKKLTGKATISVGSVGLDKEFEPGFQSGSRTGVAGIEPLLDRLERDEFDLIAIGRALIADPEWARKVRTGDTEALIPFAADQVATLR